MEDEEAPDLVKMRSLGPSFGGGIRPGVDGVALTAAPGRTGTTGAFSVLTRGSREGKGGGNCWPPFGGGGEGVRDGMMGGMMGEMIGGSGGVAEGERGAERGEEEGRGKEAAG